MTAEMAHCRGAVQYCRYSRTDRRNQRSAKQQRGLPVSSRRANRRRWLSVP